MQRHHAQAERAHSRHRQAPGDKVGKEWRPGHSFPELHCDSRNEPHLLLKLMLLACLNMMEILTPARKHLLS